MRECVSVCVWRVCVCVCVCVCEVGETEEEYNFFVLKTSPPAHTHIPPSSHTHIMTSHYSPLPHTPT